MKTPASVPIIVIFGITGDLSKRKLLPALYHLIAHGYLESGTRIIGTSRREMDKDELLKNVELCILEAKKICDPIGLKKMYDSLELIKLDPSNDTDYDRLKEVLDSYDEGGEHDRLLYMALPPKAYAPVITKLGGRNLNSERTRLLVEKPFGNDVRSAESLIETMNQHFREEQIYRIDHYLAKETAQNLLAFRLHNPIFSSLWSGDHIEKIHIKASEEIDIEGRADFYEGTGALRDIIQSHLIQLLAVVMMDQPIDSTSESIHEGKEVFLRSLTPADPSKARRAQYDGYKKEVDNDTSLTETYARVELASRAARWEDTRIVLETGKALNEKSTEVIVQFKHPHLRARNQLRFRIQPNESITLDLVVKKPGFENKMHHTELDFTYEKSFDDDQYPDAYERVIMDAVKGDQALFTSSQELLYAWSIVQPILDAWEKDNDGLISYKKGSEYIPDIP